MIRTAAGCLALALLFLLGRRFFPKKKIFAIFCAILIGIGGFLAVGRHERPNPAAADRTHAAKQQMLVAEWHEEYQRLIVEMDRNWQQYHRILSDFDKDAISLAVTHERLKELSDASRLTLEKVEKMSPPLELDDENYDLMTAIMEKTRLYAEAQQITIRHTANVADPMLQLSAAQEDQSRRLRDVMRSESPAGLFTAKELSALKENVDKREF